MINSGTQPSNVNPDSTKWSDCIGEFCASASSSGSFGSIVASVSSVSAATVVAVIVTGTMSGPIVICAGAIAGLFAFCAASAVVLSASFAKDDSVVRSRPLARRLGAVFPSLAALAAGSFTAHAIVAGPQSTDASLSAAPDVVFNVTAEGCKSERVKAAINKIKADGFSVACAKPAP